MMTGIVRRIICLPLVILCGTLFLPPAARSASGTLIETGRSFYAEARYPEAEAAFRRAVARRPRSAEAHYWLGMACYAQKRDPDALKEFKRAVKLDGKRADGYIGMGRTYLRMNRREKARKVLRKAARLDPGNADIPYYLGLTNVRTVLGMREHGLDGRRFFRKAIALSPFHPDAYYQLGMTYAGYPERDCAKAIPYLFDQLFMTPRHADALVRLARCCLKTGRVQEGADLVELIAGLPGAEENPKLRTVRAQLHAVALQVQRRYDAAFDSYRAYLASLTPEERAYYADLRYVAPAAEAAQFAQASPEERADLVRRFWAARDPDPATAVNERLLEHYRRVMYARTFFSHAQSPWDRRGEIYVRYGAPDDRQNLKIITGLELDTPIQRGGFSTPGPRLSPRNWRVDYETTQDARVDAIREIQHRRYEPPVVSGAAVIESWVYNRYNLDLTFIDPWKKEHFDYPPMITQERNFNRPQLDFHPKRLAEALIEKTPEDYPFDYGGDPLKFRFDAVTYKGENGNAQVEVAYSVPARQLGYVGDGQGGDETSFDSHFVLRDQDWYRKTAVAMRIAPVVRPRFKIPKKRARTEVRTAMLSLRAPAGRYHAAISVRDSVSRRIGIYKAPLTVGDYTGHALNMSDIRLSSSITPVRPPGVFVRNGLEITPNPSHLYQKAQPVYIYYEIYNLNRDEEGRTAYRTDLEITALERKMNIFWRFLSGFGRLLSKANEPRTVVLSFEDAGKKGDEYKFTSIDTGESPAADYKLTLTITDLHTGKKIAKSAVFTVADDGRHSAVEDDKPESIDMTVKSEVPDAP